MRRIFIPALIFVFLILIFLLCSLLRQNHFRERKIILTTFSKAPVKEADKNFPKGPAKEEDKKPEKAKEEYTGVETCQTCHPQVYDQLAKTAMGTLFLKHPRTATEKLGCETCHGPGTEHVGSGGKSFEGMVRFTKGTPTPFPCATMPVSSAIKRGRGFSGRVVFMTPKASLAHRATWSIRDRE